MRGIQSTVPGWRLKVYSDANSLTNVLGAGSPFHTATLRLLLLVFSFGLAAETGAQSSNPEPLEAILDRARGAYGINNENSPAFAKLSGSAKIRDIKLGYNNTWDRQAGLFWT